MKTALPGSTPGRALIGMGLSLGEGQKERPNPKRTRRGV